MGTDNASEFAAISTGGEQRSNEKINANRWVTRFHLRHARLARSNSSGKLCLRPVTFLAKAAQST